MQTINPRPLSPILSTFDDIITEVSLTEKPVLLPIDYQYGIAVDFVSFDKYSYGGVVKASDGSHKALAAYLVNYTNTTQTPVVSQTSGSKGILTTESVSEVYIIPEHNCKHHAFKPLLDRIMREYLHISGGFNV